MNENNELAVVDRGEDLALNLTGERKSSYTSLGNETNEEKQVLYKAMSNPDKRLADCINTVIYAKDLFMEMVDMTNSETGEITSCPRIVIVDKDNVSYQSVSFGIYNALKRVISVFGAPTWDEPIPLKVIQVTRGEKKMLSLDVQF
jgi:hypothetical protein